jgi:hypothetical protein
MSFGEFGGIFYAFVVKRIRFYHQYIKERNMEEKNSIWCMLWDFVLWW